MQRQCILHILLCLFGASLAMAQTDGSNGGDWVIPLFARSESLTSQLSGKLDTDTLPSSSDTTTTPASSIVEFQIIPVGVPLRPLVAVSVGTFSGGTFTHARLRLLEASSPPADGIYDLVLEGFYTPSPILLLQTIPTYTLLTPPPDAKGIRVKAAGDAAVTVMLPHPWVGKRLVRKGEIYIGPLNTIAEQDITQEYLIFTPTQNDAPDRMIKKGRLRIHIDTENIITNIVEG